MFSVQKRAIASTKQTLPPAPIWGHRASSCRLQKSPVKVCAWGRDEEISLAKQSEEKAAMLLHAEKEAAPKRPLVRFTVKGRIGLGEVFKVSGSAPELARWTPDIAPVMTWNNGDVWILETRMRPGTHKFKVVMRKGDRSYTWEESAERTIEVPQGLKPTDVIEVPVTNVKMNSFVLA